MRKKVAGTLVLILFLGIYYSSFARPVDGDLKQRLEKHLYTLADDSMFGRQAGSEHAFTTAKYIAQQFREIGLEPYKDEMYLQPFVYKKGIRSKSETCHNVIGILRGNDPRLSNEYIILGAHFDHIGAKYLGDSLIIYNGADDNASGVSVLLETARALKQRQNELKRSIIFVGFDAEETGLNGSKYFIRHPIVPLENIKLMISMDMVGWYQKSGQLMYFGSGTITKGRELLTGADVVPKGLKIKIHKFEKDPLIGTDTEPFAQKGISTLHATTGLTSPYHKPEDDPELIDYKGLALITEHITNIAVKFCMDSGYQPSGKISPKHNQPKTLSFGLSINAGTNHLHYTSGNMEGKKSGIYSAGLYSNVRFGSVISLRPEILYERTGAKHPKGKIWTNSVTAPLHFVIRTPDYASFGIGFLFGGYYTYHFSGRQAGERADFTKDYYCNEAGLSWGLSFIASKISIGVVIRYAVTDFARDKTTEGALIRNRSTFCNISYRF